MFDIIDQYRYVYYHLKTVTYLPYEQNISTKPKDSFYFLMALIQSRRPLDYMLS